MRLHGWHLNLLDETALLDCARRRELALFAALNLYDDWTLEMMPLKFVACAILCGLAFCSLPANSRLTGRTGAYRFLVGDNCAAPPRSTRLRRATKSGVIRRTARFNASDSIRINSLPIIPIWLALFSNPDAFRESTSRLRLRRGRTFVSPYSGEATRLIFKIVFGLADLAAVALLLRCVDFAHGRVVRLESAHRLQFCRRRTFRQLRSARARRGHLLSHAI